MGFGVFLFLALVLLGLCTVGFGCFPTRPSPARDPLPELDRAAAPAQFRVRARWMGRVPIRVEMTGDQLPVPTALAESALDAAIAQWRAAGVPIERTVGGVDSDPPSIVIEWVPPQHGECRSFRGWDGGYAHAGPVTDPTFVHINRGAAWTSTETPPETARQVLTHILLHELGHTFGLDHFHRPDTVMAVDRDPPRTQLTWSDRAAAATLFGGFRPGPGDLMVGDRVLLRGVAPEGAIDFAVLDTNGDGREEIVTWPLQREYGDGPTLYHFDEDGRLLATQGPARGLTPPGVGIPVSAAVIDGRAWLVLTAPDGRTVAYEFTRGRGLPLRPATPPKAPWASSVPRENPPPLPAPPRTLRGYPKLATAVTRAELEVEVVRGPEE